MSSSSVTLLAPSGFAVTWPHLKALQVVVGRPVPSRPEGVDVVGFGGGGVVHQGAREERQQRVGDGGVAEEDCRREGGQGRGLRGEFEGGSLRDTALSHMMT